MSANHEPRHTAPQGQGITLYKPAAVSFARHRKPNRRGIVWHLDNLAADMVRAVGERAMRDRG